VNNLQGGLREKSCHRGRRTNAHWQLWAATIKTKGLSDIFAGRSKELYIPAIDLETGDSIMFGEVGWRDVPISRADTASSAVPMYFCPIEI
jgi:predicted acylesterase/phospholipase RssA